MAERLAIDPIRCDGYGLCAEAAPNLVALDDWGYPVIEGSPLVSGSLLREARRAVEACPVLALRLRAVAVTQGGHHERQPTAVASARSAAAPVARST